MKALPTKHVPPRRTEPVLTRTTERGYVEVDTMVRTREASVISRNPSVANGSLLFEVAREASSDTLILVLAAIAPSSV